MYRRLVSAFAHCALDRQQNSCVLSWDAAAAVLAILLTVGGWQSVSAGISFSGDVILNTGIPTSPVMVGRQSVGSLRLDNGTSFTSGPAQFGLSPTGIGSAIVTGARTTWNMPSADVGPVGVGRLDINDGALVDTMRLTIGGQNSGHGTVSVDGEGSTLQVRGPTSIAGTGMAAVGRLEISNQAIVNAVQTQVMIGRNGRVVLDGGLLRTMGLQNEGLISGSGEIQLTSPVPFNQPGRIEVGEGDHLLVSGIGSALQNMGLIAVDGGEIEITRPVNNVRQGSFLAGEVTLRNGTMRVGGFTPDGPQFTNTGLLAAIGGENHFYGRVQVPAIPPTIGAEIAVTNNSVLTFHDDVTLQGGMMTVFAGSKAILLEDLALSSGSVLLADIAGSSVDTEYGEIEVVGNVNLGGSIRLVVSDSYTPAAGDSFPIIKALGGVNGTLALTDMPPLHNRLMWDLDIGTNHVALNVVQAPPGDYNTDGVVDAGDYVVWRRAVGQSGSGLSADGNSDGVVDAADYNYWRANFGNALGGTSSTPVGVATSVPEPGTSILLGVAAVAVIGWLRKRTHS